MHYFYIFSPMHCEEIVTCEIAPKKFKQNNELIDSCAIFCDNNLCSFTNSLVSQENFLVYWENYFLFFNPRA